MNNKTKTFIIIIMVCFFVILIYQVWNHNNTSKEVEEIKIWVIGWNDIDTENDIARATQLQSIEYCPFYDNCAMSTDGMNWIKIEQSYSSYKGGN